MGCALYKKKCGKSMTAVDESKMTCDDLAKKCKAGDKKACQIYKEKCGKDEKMTCDDLAEKCKAGDKKACEIYEEKCGKENPCDDLAKNVRLETKKPAPST